MPPAALPGSPGLDWEGVPGRPGGLDKVGRPGDEGIPPGLDWPGVDGDEGMPAGLDWDGDEGEPLELGELCEGVDGELLGEL